MKKGNRYFSPLTFNLLAVVWIIGLLPIAVAFVSNVGNDPDNANYQQMSVDNIDLIYGEGNNPTYGDAQLCTYAFNCTGLPLSWVENGGTDLSDYYEYANPDVELNELDCYFIEDGICKGTFDPQNDSQATALGSYYRDCDTTGFFFQGQAFNVNPQVQYNCEFADPSWSYYDAILTQQVYTQDLIYDGSYFYRGSDAHSNDHTFINPNNATDLSWAGESGDTFSFRLNELMMNRLPAGEMVDSLRLTFFDFPDQPLATPAHHNCDNYAGWADLSIDSKVSITFEGEERTLQTTYTTSTDNKWYYTAQPSFFPSSGCYIGYEVLIDFNGFDAREMYNFADNGKWNQSTMIIEMKFERTDGQALGSTNLGINGIDDFQFAIDYTEIEAQQVEFATNAGLLTMGTANIVLAIASTAYWDPFRNFFKGRL